MVRLADADILTRDVLDWRGVHLLHAPGSSCSQKTRIFLNLKEIPWTSHPIDLKAAENLQAWYLGINPRGLVPCLVHDGAVHIESNDIIEYLEACFPEPPLIPTHSNRRIQTLLRVEDELHLDLRVLTFRYVIPTPAGQVKSKDALEQLRDHAGTIGGQPDPRKADQLRFWDQANRYGITDEQVARSAARFREALGELDSMLATSAYVLGDAITIVDIAWYVYVSRLNVAGYPLRRLHEWVARWFDRLDERDQFRQEVAMPPGLVAASAALRDSQSRQGRSLVAIAGF